MSDSPYERCLPQRAPVLRLAELRAGIRADVYERYKALKARGVVEEQARNIAAAQTATAPHAKHRAAVYRRELDALLDPKRKTAAFLGETFSWRNPS